MPAGPRPGGFRRATRILFAPIDIAPIAFFRVLFGAVMFWEAARYFRYGWIRLKYIEPAHHFTYYGFDWVRPWPGSGMYVHFAVLALLAACITIGLFYRLSTILFFFAFTYVFLLEQAAYLNHLYLVCLLSFLSVFIPAHRDWSVDALLRPSLRSETVPAWTLLALRAQLAIVYIYGGLAKLNADWLHGEPMRMWLAHEADRFGRFAALLTGEPAVVFFSFGGLLLDLLIVPLVLWRRTRIPAIAAAAAFHVLNNSLLFRIGIFPWLMLGATLLFLPVQGWSRLLRGHVRDATAPCPERPRPRRRRVAVTVLGIHLIVQLLVPLRHFLYPGNVSWTEEGHRFAWHMKLRAKTVASATFIVTDPRTGTTWNADPRDDLEPWQVSRMLTRPDMILQFCHRVADDLRDRFPGVEVRADVRVSLNGRPPQPMIDPTVNLAAEKRSLRPADWIVPLREPLPPRSHLFHSSSDRSDGG